MNSVLTLTSNFLKILFNIVLPFTPNLPSVTFLSRYVIKIDTHFSDALNRYSSFGVRGKVPYPNKTCDQSVDCGLLGCGGVWTYRWVPTFRRNVLPPFSGLRMKEMYFSETSVSTYKFTRRQNPEDQHRQLHRRKNPKSHEVVKVSNFIVVYFNLNGSGKSYPKFDKLLKYPLLQNIYCEMLWNQEETETETKERKKKWGKTKEGRNKRRENLCHFLVPFKFTVSWH
jgi:hypothetical protein